MGKVALIISSEKLDKIYPGVILATTAASMGWEAEVFFTFWGLLALKKGYEPAEVSHDYSKYGEAVAEAVRSGQIPEWKSLVRKGKESGKLKIYACSTTMGLLKISREDLEDFVDGVLGAASFLTRAKDADITLFIS